MVTVIHEDGGRCELTNEQFVFPFHEAVLRASPEAVMSNSCARPWCLLECPVCGNRFRKWFVPIGTHGEYFEISPSESGEGSVRITTTLTHALYIPPAPALGTERLVYTIPPGPGEDIIVRSATATPALGTVLRTVRSRGPSRPDRPGRGRTPSRSRSPRR